MDQTERELVLRLLDLSLLIQLSSMVQLGVTLTAAALVLQANCSLTTTSAVLRLFQPHTRTRERIHGRSKPTRLWSSSDEPLQARLRAPSQRHQSTCPQRRRSLAPLLLRWRRILGELSSQDGASRCSLTAELASSRRPRIRSDRPYPRIGDKC